jgi:Zn-dependent peptidase ImmA (M78 family)/DNA-binding XRE family transcriptional regulator
MQEHAHAQSSPPPIGQRLRERRERLKLTLADLCGRTGVGVSSLSEFENDKREPTLSQLKKLATAMGTDVAQFLSAGALREQTVRWREKPASAEETEARFLKLCRQYRDLERWADDEKPVQLRKAERFPSTWAEASALARQVQNEMQLGDRPGLTLQRKLEDEYGLKTFNLRIEPTGTAACTADRDYGHAVLLNSLNSRARRTFDLAHELFHLLTWEAANSTAHSRSHETEEKLADCFAATLLLPETPLREAVARRIKSEQRISVANICELAKDFGVSIDALVWRMHNVFGWRDPEETKKLITRVRSLARPYDALTTNDRESVSELPERYQMLAIQALRSGEISVGRFAEYMGLRRWEAMKYADEALGDETISLPNT